MHKHALILCTIALVIILTFLADVFSQSFISTGRRWPCRPHPSHPDRHWAPYTWLDPFSIRSCPPIRGYDCGWLRPGHLRLDLIDPLKTTLDHLRTASGTGCTSRLSLLSSLMGNGVGHAQSWEPPYPDSGFPPPHELPGGDHGHLQRPPPPPPPPPYDWQARPGGPFARLDRSQLAGKRLLIIGDSVDRVLLEYLESNVETAHFSYHALGTLDPNHSSAQSTMSPGIPRTLTFPHTIDPYFDDFPPPGARPLRAFAIDFIHFYGLDEGDIWEDKGSRVDGNGPPTMTARLRAIANIWGGVEYDFISVGSGLWDLARFQRTQYMERGADDHIGLPTHWLEEWMQDGRRLASMIRDVWPSSTVGWRVLHDPRSGAGGWFWPKDDVVAVKSVPPFTPLRIHQLRQAQLALIQEEDLEEVPLGEVMAKQGEAWLADDIHPGPAGNAVHAELLLELLMIYGL